MAWAGLLFSIFLFLLGALAVYPAFVQTFPWSKQWLDRLLPYQAVMGIIGVVWGLFWGLRLLAGAGMPMHMSPISWLLNLAGAVVAILLGLLLGYSWIDQYVLSNNAQFQQRGETMRLRLLARQGSLGWSALVLGIVIFVMLLVA
jgi:hypothetical protein